MKSALLSLRTLVASTLAATLLVASTWITGAQQITSVTSTTDGHGLFSYTFNLSTNPAVWSLAPNSGNISIQSYGILQVTTPLGWSASVDANDLISFQATTDTVYLGQPPVTFTVLSSYTDSTVYDEWGVSNPVYPRGLVVGEVCNLSDHSHIAIGYETFTMVGPAVPEPSVLALTALGLSLLKLRKSSACRRASS